MKVFIVHFCIFWFICFLPAQDLYWVGGSGDWHDPDNWSFNSGGPGGDGVPNIMNNVIFNAQSFTGPGQIVSVTQADIFFASMDWTGATGNPIFSGVAAWTATAAGSIRFIGAMQHEFFGNYRLTSVTADNVIRASGQQFYLDLIFNSTQSYVIEGDLYVERTLDFRQGRLDLGTGNISVFTFFSDYASVRELIMNTSTITLIQRVPGNAPSFVLAGDNYTVNGANGNLIFQGPAGNLRLSGTSLVTFRSVLFDVQNALLNSTTDIPPTFSNLIFSGNGQIEGNHIIDRLQLPNGFVLFLENGSRQIVRTIETGDFCDGFASIIANVGSRVQAIIEFPVRPISLEGLFLRGIRAVTSGVVIVFSGGDGGNNTGWNIQDIFSRNVYWVGGTGDWKDRANWSETSGGPGGACIPTGGDRVFFDNNSFNSPNDTVRGIAPGIVENITYSSSIRATIAIPSLYVNNNITLATPVNWQITDVFLIGNDEIGATQDRQRINSGSNVLINLTTLSQREILLDSDLNLSGTLQIDGVDRFRTAGFDIRTQFFFATDAPMMSLDLSGSCITVTGSRLNLAMPLVINNVIMSNIQGTEFKLTAAVSGLEANTGPIGSVYFTDPDGDALLRSIGDVRIRTLRFAGDGELIEARFSIDSLFFSAGHNYRLSVGLDISVNNYLEGLGGSCAPIGFSSNAPGFAAGFSMPPSAAVRLEYLEIRDLSATGGANFFAGIGSVNVGGNSGWTFPDSNLNNSVRQFLGADIRACSDSLIVLRPFQAADISNITWGDGTTQLSYNVPSSGGQVIATVTFPNTCELSDTVIINFDQAIAINLGVDTMICAGQSIVLEDLNATQGSFRWSTGDTSQMININTDGAYSVNVTRGACTATDQVNVSVIDIQAINLGRDTTLCEGQPFSLAAPTVTNGSYVWSDGTSQNTLSIVSTGTYWLEVAQGQCTRRDSIEVEFDQAIAINLGVDTMICAGQSIVLEDLNATQGSFRWSTGDTSQMININTDGAYSVNVTRGACTATDQVNVSVIDIQAINLGRDTTLCEGQPFSLAAPTVTNGSYVWSDGTSQNTLSIVSTGTYWLEVAQGQCTRRDSIEVEFDASFAISLGPDTTLCAGENLDLSVSAGFDEYRWDDASNTNMRQINAEGIYNIEVTQGACVQRDTIAVNVTTLPTFTLGRDTAVCISSNLVLNSPVQGFDLLWSNGASTPMISPAVSGLYTLQISQGRCTVSDSIVLTIDTLPLLLLDSIGMACEGETLNLDAGVANQYFWANGENSRNIDVTQSGNFEVRLQNGTCAIEGSTNINFISLPDFSLGRDTILCDGQQLSLSSPNVALPILWSDNSTQSELVVSSPNIYWVEIEDSGCTKRDSVTVAFDPQLNLFLGNDTTLCESEVLQITTNVTASEYRWSTSETTSNITVTNTGQYVLSATQGACSESDTINVSYINLDNLNLGLDRNICQGDTIVLDANIGNNLNYQWSDGSTNPQLSISTTGVYTIEVGSDRCQVSDTVRIDVDPIFSLVLPSDTIICEGEVIPTNGLGNRISFVNYQWQGNLVQDPIQGEIIQQGGVYTLVADRGACVLIDSIDVQIQIAPSLDLGNPQTACQGEMINLNARVPNSSYIWSSGEITESISVSADGVYSVNVMNGVCQVSDSVQITFAPLPEINLGRDTIICEGESINFGDPQGQLVYQWSTGASTPTINVSQPGIYSVMIEDMIGCMNTDEVNLTVNPVVAFDLGGRDTTLCENQILMLNVPFNAATITWSTGETTNDISVNQPAIYWAETNLNGCRFRDSIQLIVQELPSLTMPGDTTICQGDTYIVSPTTNSNQFNWSTGETGPNLRVNTPGLYTLMVGPSGCNVTATIDISVSPRPNFDLGADRTICEGETVILTVPSGQGDVQWNTGQMGSAINVDRSGVFSAVVDLNGCSFTDQVMITVEDLPVFDLGDDISTCDNLPITLGVPRNDVDVLWSTGQIGSVITTNELGTIVATAMSDNGCVYEDEIDISNRECQRFQLYVPDIFTPNGDATHDFFELGLASNAQIHEFRIEIFDRVGSQVFVSEDPNMSWDGNVRLNPAAVGVYSYVVRIRFSDDFDQNRLEVLRGSLTLLR